MASRQLRAGIQSCSVLGRIWGVKPADSGTAGFKPLWTWIHAGWEGAMAELLPNRVTKAVSVGLDLEQNLLPTIP